MHERRFVESFNAAVEGFVYVLKSERNMRVHFLAALFIILLAIYLNFSMTDVVILCTVITFVLMTEMVNTTVELVVDVVKPEYHPMARIIKDVSAGAVLISAINAVIVGYTIFSRNLPFTMQMGMMRIRQSPWHLTFISVILVFGASIIGKLIFHKGTPLRGGMPSGHSAVAFSIWTIITFMSDNSIIVVLSFIMAFLIARHRVKDAVHTVWEVIAGGILGVLLTTLVFQLLR